MASGRRTLRAIFGMNSMLNPVIRQVIEPNNDIKNGLPPMANFGDRALAMVMETNATVVITPREPMS